MYQFKLGTAVIPVVAALLTPLAGIAQPISPPQIPRPILPAPVPSPRPPTPQPPPTFEVPPSRTLPAPQIPENIPGSIKVGKFKFEGNRGLSDKQLEKAVAPFTGRYITPAELRQALDAINRLYLKSGYILSGVRVPARLNQQQQSIDNAVIAVEVVEAQVEQINVLGSDGRRPGEAHRLENYLRSRLKRAVSPALSEQRLVEALRLLQQDPLIKNLSAQIQPGSRKDLWILSVRVTPEPPLRLQVGIDNNRSPAVGSIQRSLEFTNNNLFGIGDRLELGYFNTDGSNAGTGSYTVPFNTRGGTVNFDTTILSSEIVEEPFNQLDLISDYRAYELSVRQPLIRKATERSTQELALGLTASRQESESSLLGEPFPLSSGADDLGKTRISALRFFQEYTRQDARNSLALKSQFSVGLGLGSTINPEPPDSRFFHWRGDGQYVRLLAPDAPMIFRFGVQAADRELVGIEQLGIGGPGTVRGYRRDILLANSGAFASIEARFPIYRSSRLPGLLQVGPFFDLGTSFDGKQGLGQEANHFLASVGLGLQLQIADSLSARLEYGIPLVPETTQGGSIQEQGVTFAIYYDLL